MPTVKDLIAELKQLGVRGYSKKLKGELMYMVEAAKKAKKEVKKPEPIKISIKDLRAKKASKELEEAKAENRKVLEEAKTEITNGLTDAVKEAKKRANKGIFTEYTADMYFKKNIEPIIDKFTDKYKLIYGLYSPVGRYLSDLYFELWGEFMNIVKSKDVKK